MLLSDLSRATVRELVMVADNEARLFSGRLRDELTGVTAASNERVQEALRAASAVDIVDALPDGLDSLVAERGREFSGGQQQRLRLARALLADPPVLILVEPTSAVDAHTEARVAARLAAARTGRTTVVCTTSPLVLDRADEVLYVESGRLVAAGPAPRAAVHLTVVRGDRHPRGGRRMSRPLPVASVAEVRRYAAGLARRHPRGLFTALGLHGLAAMAGLSMPWLIGGLVQSIQRGTTLSTVDKVALAIAGFVVVQAVLTRYAKLASAKLGEQVLAELREDFVDRTLAIPLSTVEKAGTGDLLTRTSRDVDQLSHSVRFAVPEVLIAIVTVRCSPSRDGAGRRRCSRSPAGSRCRSSGPVRAGTSTGPRRRTCGRAPRTRT